MDSSYLTAEAAKYLYTGICTDTGFFQFPSTSASTFKAIMQLMETGFDRQEIHNAIKNKTLNEKKFDLYIQKLVKYDLKRKLAYLVIPKGTFKKFNVKPSSMVYTMAGLKEVET
jgi:phosphoesterase RecJ-like protein